MKSAYISLFLIFICCSKSKEGRFEKGLANFFNHNWIEAESEFRPLAKAGDCKAMYYVSLCYSNMNDDSVANQYLISSARCGEYRSASLVGNKYQNYNDSIANYWYSMGIKQLQLDLRNNNPDAELEMGLRYLRGCGVTLNERKAHDFFDKAAADYLSLAIKGKSYYYLQAGNIYRYWSGDVLKAVGCFEKGASSGYSQANVELTQLLKSNPDLKLH